MAEINVAHRSVAHLLDRRAAIWSGLIAVAIFMVSAR